MGYAIIVPAILVTYLLGGKVSVLEMVINLIGGALFLAIGGLAIERNTQLSSKCHNSIA